MYVPYVILGNTELTCVKLSTTLTGFYNCVTIGKEESYKK